MYYFITYGDEEFRRSKKVLVKQVKKLDIFDFTKAYDPDDLDDSFKERFSEILSKRRGGGHYIWKPYIVRKTLSLMKEDDILVYADAGCRIEKKNKDKFFDYFDIVNRSKYGCSIFSARV